MSKRIEKLAQQAGLPVIDGEWDYNDREILCRENGEWRAATPAEIISVLFACEKGREKFAELIVQKCAQRCEKIALKYHALETTYAAGKKAGAFECAADLKKYFGVE